MADYNIWPTLIAVDENRRAREESNYIAEKRRVDAASAAETARLSNAARDERVKKYGAQAYDPVIYGQMEGIRQNAELHPGEVAKQSLGNEEAAATIKNTAEDRQRAAADRMFAGLAASGAKTPEQAAQYFAALSPEELAATDTDPAKIPQLIEALSQFPDVQTGAQAMRQRVAPQRMSQVIEGTDPSGARVAYAVPEGQAPGPIPGVRPDPKYNPNPPSTVQVVPGAGGYFDKTTRTFVSDPGMVEGQAAVTGAKAGANVTAKDSATAKVQLPGAKKATERFVSVLDSLIASPGLKAITGLPGLESALQGGPGGMTDFLNKHSVVPGSPAADAMMKMRQLQDLAKIQGIAYYDGKGALSNAEGETAGNAVVPLFTQGSYEAVVQNLRLARQAQFDNIEVLEQRAGGGAASGKKAGTVSLEDFLKE